MKRSARLSRKVRDRFPSDQFFLKDDLLVTAVSVVLAGKTYKYGGFAYKRVCVHKFKGGDKSLEKARNAVASRLRSKYKATALQGSPVSKHKLLKKKAKM